jgi:hypothetical protein
LRPPDPSRALASAPPIAPDDDIEGGGAEGEKRGQRLGEEKERGCSGVRKTLEGSEIKRLARHEKLSQFNTNKSYMWCFDGTLH